LVRIFGNVKTGTPSCNLFWASSSLWQAKPTQRWAS